VRVRIPLARCARAVRQDKRAWAQARKRRRIDAGVTPWVRRVLARPQLAQEKKSKKSKEDKKEKKAKKASKSGIARGACADEACVV